MKTLTRQEKAGITNRKNKLIKRYKAATTSGQKMAINKQYKKLFGELIPKDTEVEITKKPQPIDKTYFFKKEVILLVPAKINSLIEERTSELTKRIECLEKLIK
jgi:hypothetical protein